MKKSCLLVLMFLWLLIPKADAAFSPFSGKESFPSSDSIAWASGYVQITSTNIQQPQKPNSRDSNVLSPLTRMLQNAVLAQAEDKAQREPQYLPATVLGGLGLIGFLWHRIRKARMA